MLPSTSTINFEEKASSIQYANTALGRRLNYAEFSIPPCAAFCQRKFLYSAASMEFLPYQPHTSNVHQSTNACQKKIEIKEKEKKFFIFQKQEQSRRPSGHNTYNKEVQWPSVTCT